VPAEPCVLLIVSMEKCRSVFDKHS
jgi:hypothetical protein